MDAVIKEVAEEGKRLIDRAWLGELSHDQAVHLFVQFGDGLVHQEIAHDIIDDGVRRLSDDAKRLRLLRWCAVIQLPVFGGFAILALLLGEYATAALSLTFLAILQIMHYRLLTRPAPRDPPQ
ncbi:hypothetical protein [Nocardia callitridis]|uniref:Uncharacterized protein n=1 Tax=Nocardia callitridis TaxID=648753 RepID=A0ABP9KQX1_9NOCA